MTDTQHKPCGVNTTYTAKKTAACYAKLDTLKFRTGNAKLNKSIATFSLPAGHTCPFAKECLSKSDLLTGKIIDGQHCRFRCFAATSEARATNVRKQRWGNFTILKDAKREKKMGEIIQHSLPHGMDKIRVHVSGDFFNEWYYVAWLNVALNNPLVTFYGYTKALPFWVKYLRDIPNNFRFTASKGGTHDHLIGEYGLRSAEVVFSVEEAFDKGLEIDHDDSHAIAPNGKDFALLIHATQPVGTPAAAAWAKIMRSGIGGYGGKSDFRRQGEIKSHVVYISVNGGRVFVKNKVEPVAVPESNANKLTPTALLMRKFKMVYA